MSHKQKKKLVMAEGGGRSCVRNLCSKLCCFFLPSGWGVQRLRQRSAHSKGFPPLQKKRNTWQFLKVENKITCKRERKVLQPLQQKVRFKLTIWFQPWHHFYWGQCCSGRDFFCNLIAITINWTKFHPPSKLLPGSNLSQLMGKATFHGCISLHIEIFSIVSRRVLLCKFWKKKDFSMSIFQQIFRYVVISPIAPLQPLPVASWLVGNTVSVAEPKPTDATGYPAQRQGTRISWTLSCAAKPSTDPGENASNVWKK